MRIAVVLAITVTLLSPLATSAQTGRVSSASVVHAVIHAGQTETVVVLARDLAGNPLTGAAVSGDVRYGTKQQTLRFPRTNHQGKTWLTFHPPAGITRATAQVSVAVSNGYLRIPLFTHFSVAAVAPHVAAPSLVAIARALPASVTVPNPIWVVVYAHDRSGHSVAGAEASAVAAFREGAVHASGVTDSSGIATLRINTGMVKATQKVRVVTIVHWRQESTTTTTEFQVAKPAAAAVSIPTPTPTATAPSLPAPTPTPTATPTPTPLPTPTDTPSPTPTAVSPVFLSAPAATFTPTATPTPTPSPTATSTLVPTPTATLVPTDTPTPTPTSTPTNTPTPYPTATSTPMPNCPGSQSGCTQAILNMINSARAQYGYGPLTLDLTQSNGTGNCVGSYGHSVAMQQSGYIWHDNANYPQASFPADICGYGSTVSSGAENVGMNSVGTELQELQYITDLMLPPNESWSPGCTGNHACNMLSPLYRRVGIGIVYSGNTTWLTEDFVS